MINAELQMRALPKNGFHRQGKGPVGSFMLDNRLVSIQTPMQGLDIRTIDGGLGVFSTEDRKPLDTIIDDGTYTFHLGGNKDDCSASLTVVRESGVVFCTVENYHDTSHTDITIKGTGILAQATAFLNRLLLK